MTQARRRTGSEGEDLAARHLEAQGYRILARGYRTRFGELDLVASHGPLLVFVEVKSRRSDAFGPPAAAVHAAKQARLARLAAHFMATRGPADTACRFDVIAVTLGGPRPVLEHIQDAFRPV
jgi:putative endonuclease